VPHSLNRYNYENLITAHHLGDRFEWMLMQFCKGSGCAELAGMQEISKRGNYSLIRPLLHLDKQELLHFLQENRIKYFEDETNFDEDIKRNSFRHNYSSPLLKKYLNGIKKSFEYLDEDRASLIQETELKSDKYIFIAPFIKTEKLSKKFKEKMRLLKIEPKLRGYLSKDKNATEAITQLLS